MRQAAELPSGRDSRPVAESLLVANANNVEVCLAQRQNPPNRIAVSKCSLTTAHWIGLRNRDILTSRRLQELFWCRNLSSSHHQSTSPWLASTGPFPSLSMKHCHVLPGRGAKRSNPSFDIDSLVGGINWRHYIGIVERRASTCWRTVSCACWLGR